MKQTIKSLGVLSVAKIMGAVYFALGLLFVPFFLLIGVAGLAMDKSGSFPGNAGGIGMVVLAVVTPFLYGAIGFVGGAIAAALYNLVAKWTGGIEIELQPGAGAAAAGQGM